MKHFSKIKDKKVVKPILSESTKELTIVTAEMLKDVTVLDELEKFIPKGIDMWIEDITEVQIPKTVKEIGERAFYNCISLESLEIPDSVTKIGDKAFLCCRHLKSASLPKTITSLGSGIFDGCSNINTVKLAKGFKTEFLVKLQDEYKEIKFILDGTIKESEEAPSITDLGSADLCLAEVFKTLKDKDLKPIWNYLPFDYLGSDLTSVEIPAGVTCLGKLAFRGCKNLKTVKIPDTVKKIEKEAFSGCELLEKLELPASLEEIGQNAFASCSALEEIVIPESVKVIRVNAFFNCGRLRFITLPDSIKTIEFPIVEFCDSLELIKLPLGFEKTHKKLFKELQENTSVDFDFV